MSVNISKVVALLKNRTLSTINSGSNDDMKNQVNESVKMTKRWYLRKNIYQTSKLILWQGVLRDFGTFGLKPNSVRKFSKKDKPNETFDFHQSFGRGKLLSVDFGASNIDRELALTHTGIVIADYTGMVVVIPITSQDSLEIDTMSEDIKSSLIPVSCKEFNQFKNDSYVLVHQMRVISKNRITRQGVVGSIANTKLMDQIEDYLLKTHTPYMSKMLNEQIQSLTKQNEKLIEELLNLKKLQETIDK
ncbi:type II toxin-antitoxin system PemK/MazF family toxin [Evansella tamaricis]|uniref:Type II toxin-antitoxin system PemK/MazF family toxin n=1 Tax=Evansella tamaricis TaxID=2069301 RepID=A0ABS6JNQ8_9BACI|nr:type II toxin-antitoxin system PemK/MazF family toxin [Evansella tamaricis]MBU9714442.1 type II toxin-antitoxin system PemK/MazF family toxin [Evansella tamaricis]